MEVGAVKQAYNNEVIHLKKNLNQARIQIIHKLTRKAKTLVEKKGPDHLKEKNKKKAESAVNEVLIMKKLKPRDIARFIITYKGQLQAHLNKPQVDKDKACARLLLHKALQQKYKSIKETFGDVSIDDLLMSRQERLKLKKEQKLEQKNKKKKKEQKNNKVVNAEGDWDVEDVVMGETKKESKKTPNKLLKFDEIQQSDDDKESGVENNDLTQGSDVQESDGNIEESDNDDQEIEGSNDEKSEGSEQEFEEENHDQESDVESEKQQIVENSDDQSGDEEMGSDNNKNSDGNSTDEEEKIEPIKLMPKQTKDVNHIKIGNTKKVTPKANKKTSINKNKKLDAKILNRKFKKTDEENFSTDTKVVDPFFITESGGNYMSVAERRAPDEVKEEHREGNRKLRRAIMFGHVPKPKPRNRQDNYNNYDGQRNDRPNNYDRQKQNDGKFNNKNDRFNNSNNRNDKFGHSNDRFNSKNDRFNSSDNRFNNKNDKFNSNDRFNKSNDMFNNSNDRFKNKFNDRKFNNNTNDVKEEKLHPSWEAKKKQSGILPFQGKKIVFDS